MQTIALFAFIAAAAHGALAVCPGFNFAVGSAVGTGNGQFLHQIYDDGCNDVSSIATNGNIAVNEISLSGLNYACRTDPNSGVCNGDTITVCCRNDGN